MRFQKLLWVTALLATGATAQTMKPGLWEITNQMQGAAGGQMAEMQKQLASLPPEQRKMMEEMMAKQGVQMGKSTNGGMAIKVCMTKEMIERNDVAQQQDGCTHTTSPRSGNTMKFAFVCTKPPSRGDGQVTFVSSEAYTMQMKATSSARGKEETMDMQTQGKWLGTDCGSVKPLGGPKG
ncbi:DUF3617 domain-containing protein [Rhodoferax saidenbachensis]|uniref:DUF3617 domain-containing protein n=1 Tax=Rhodoferax saidenbachensis TaxID=1484693 RepID=A0A1P8K611_9BURK|nr:DUF3617 domain-containing protein [Rhodoferax saidenbachensis]APW41429.1 hypothetical protein RS694_01915 [Rhodoferax saidenbachensis]